MRTSVARLDRLTDHRHAVAQTRSTEGASTSGSGILTHLDQRTQLLVEQYGSQLIGSVGQAIEIQAQTAMAGKGHLQRRGQQATVGAVVISQQPSVGVQALNHGEECLEVLGVIQIRHRLPELGIRLRQD
jgi:hypothetical protein